MFKTDRERDEYFAAYDATMALWPVPVESLEISTRFGPTHVNLYAPKDAPALILFHGAGISSTQWYPNIKSLSQYFRVYAPDIIGEIGKSVRTSKPLKRDDYPLWMADLLAGLELETTHVGGLSFGGYLALTMAINFPGKAKKLILMSPAGISPPMITSIFRMLVAFVPFLPVETKQKIILGFSTLNLEPLIEQIKNSGGFRYKFPLLRKYSDKELQRINAPTLLLVGKNEVVFNNQKLIARCKKNISKLTIREIPNAGHALSIDQPEIVNHRILNFLQAES